MGGVLIVTEVEKVFAEVGKAIGSGEKACVYVALNKSKEDTELELKKQNVDVSQVLFIDAISESVKTRNDRICVKPRELAMVLKVIKLLCKEIREQKKIVVDSLVTLLIYNSQNAVAEFLRSLITFANAHNIEFIAVSQKTKEEDLLNKVYNFFEKVIKK
jgi:archaellum biogenesis ATPase FlaH